MNEVVTTAERLLMLAMAEKNEIEQALARALGTFPWYKDDQKNWPGTTDADGVCTGNFTVLDVVDQAVARITNGLSWKDGPPEVVGLYVYRCHRGWYGAMYFDESYVGRADWESTGFVKMYGPLPTPPAETADGE